MTAAITTQEKHNGPSTLLHALTLIFALLTMVSALLSIILGSRLSTLQTNFQKANIETVTSEAASIQGLEATLKTAMDKLDTTQKSLNEEKAAAERIRRQLAGVMKDLEKAKADLALANQTISKLKSTVPAQSTPAVAAPETITTPIVAPSTETVLSPAPLPQSVLQPSESSMAPPAAATPPPDTPPPVTEETISESPKAPPPPAAPANN